MDDSTTTSYVNSYSPPADPAPAAEPTPVVATPTPMLQPAPTLEPAPAPQLTPAPVSPAPAPMPAAAPTATPTMPTSSSVSQSLEDQNIFFLLGVGEGDGTEQDKEAFLDELQQVIWEDFLENDVELLVTEEELAELKKIMADQQLNNLELQEKIIIYLEKLIPDLEEIMLEKALELKEDMARERVAGMREYYSSNAAALATINKAEEAMNSNRWRDAAEFLNSL